ncbi:hypothetical protein NKJ90_14880 [Mesorhizobium sp. M0051]|uniref:hypothetical protein n=1 Tax=Mesorhizobium sp. M0051 TaxID=2956862 RepID=UPI0033396817
MTAFAPRSFSTGLARAFTRTGIDWSKRHWPIVAAAEKLKAKSFILDGESARRSCGI